MFKIIIVGSSFVVAVLGLIQSNRARNRARSVLGLTRVGVVMVGVSTLGLLAGLSQEVVDQRAARESADLLREVHAQVVGLEASVTEGSVAEHLGRISTRISAAESMLRGSNFVASILTDSRFAMSDFSGSDFSMGKFSNANFRDALFDGAQLQGADLSHAYIDEMTKLPDRATGALPLTPGNGATP